jgi:hypothetical protein
MSNIHDLDDDDEAMKILEKISFESWRNLESFMKILRKFWWENELVSFLFCEMKTDTDEW